MQDNSERADASKAGDSGAGMNAADAIVEILLDVQQHKNRMGAETWNALQARLARGSQSNHADELLRDLRSAVQYDPSLGTHALVFRLAMLGALIADAECAQLVTQTRPDTPNAKEAR